jgi:hypothetical protein
MCLHPSSPPQILLDRYGPAARTVAKELNRKGYNKVFVIQGGFDGRGGWVQSKLQIKPAANLSTAIAPPQVGAVVKAGAFCITGSQSTVLPRLLNE